MSGLDLHPEELLDKAASGTLSASERVWLDQHLAQCSACRFEQAARADFAAAAAPIGDVQVDSLVARALAGMPTQPQRAFGGRRRTPWVLAAAVAMFALGSFAAVGQWTGVLPRLVERLVAPEPAPSPVVVIPHGVAPPRVREPLPEQPTVVEEVPVVAPKPAVKHVPVTAPAPAAAELFSLGNAARIRGDRAEAALRYGELLRKFASSDEARLTRATLGRMLLDTGDAKGALEQLDLYLASGDDTLREEAMAARARALALLARTGDEAAAWSALLQQYPDSVHAERARARLQELGR